MDLTTDLLKILDTCVNFLINFLNGFQTIGRFRLRISLTCSGWAAVPRELSSSGNSARRRSPSRKSEMSRKRISNIYGNSITQILYPSSEYDDDNNDYHERNED